MATIKIFSENAVFQSFEALKNNRNKRHRRRAFFVEGVRNINAASQYGWRFDAFLYEGAKTLSKWARGIIGAHGVADIYELSPGLMKKLSSKDETSEIAAVVHMRDVPPRDVPCFPVGLPGCGSPVFILLDRPSGKGNLGSIIRSCDAFGVKALFRTGHSVDFYDPEVIAASTGSFFAVPFYDIPENNGVDKFLTALRREYPGILVAGTSSRGDCPLFDADLSGPVLFLIGNEADGLSWKLKQSADVVAAIPMSGASYASSLNISCAVAAMLCEACRQRA